LKCEFSRPDPRFPHGSREVGFSPTVSTNPDNSCHGNVRFHADLLGQLVVYWAHEYTEVIITNEALFQLPAAERLLAIMEMSWEHDLAGLDLH